jgi:GTP-binding protein
MIGTLLEANPYPRPHHHRPRRPPAALKPNQTVKVLSGDGSTVETGRISKILAFRGLERQPIDEAVRRATSSDRRPGPRAPSPTRSATPSVTRADARAADRSADGDDDLHGQRQPARRHRGRQGHQPRHPRPPVESEAEGNVALKIEESADKDSFFVSGPRRIAARRPDRDDAPRGLRACRVAARVVMQKGENGELLEPIEEVVIDVDEEHSGVVVQKMSERKAEMVELRPSGGDRQRLVFHAPTRGLIGYQSELLTDTRGTAVMNRLFHSYQPYKGDIAAAHATAC